MRQLTNPEIASREFNRLLKTAIAAYKVEIFDNYPSDHSASLDAWLRGEPDMSRQLIEEYLGKWKQQCVDSGTIITRIHAVDRIPESSERSYLAHEIYIVYPFLLTGVERIFLAPRTKKTLSITGDFWLFMLENHTVVFQWHYSEQGLLQSAELIADQQTVNKYQAVWRELYAARQILPKL